MSRTIVSLPPKDMRWLKSTSKRQGHSIAETIREALAEYRVRMEGKEHGSAIEATSGIWKDRDIDALEYVEKLRSEWDK